MKNFFEQQDKARLVTKYLVFLFFCAIAGTTLILYMALLMAEVVAMERVPTLWQPEHLLLSGLVVIVGVGYGSFQKSQSLRGGGPVVAASLGGVAVDPSTADPQQKELLNVVQEMAIAAGVPYPKVYVLPDRSINAFAAGHTHKDAVVAVTQGTLDQLTRDELQGVVGHEFSHILNGDMALNLRLIGLVHGLLLMHLIGRELLYHTRFGRRKKEGSWILWLGLGMMVGGGVGWIFGQLIKSAVSRQREFLADAAAVQFTRNPEGLASALSKIAAGTVAGMPGGRSLIDSPKAAETSHLFFSPPIKAGFFSAMATHPPLSERIRRLSGQAVYRTSTTGKVARTAGVNNANVASALANSETPVAGLTSSNTAGTALQTPLPAASTPINASTNPPTSASLIEQRFGESLPSDLLAAQVDAQALGLEQLPDLLLKAVRSPVGSVAVVYSLLLDSDAAVRQQQKALIENSSLAVSKALAKVEPLVDDIALRSRLPLLDLCIPSLTTIQLATISQSLKCVQSLVRVSGKLSISEFALKTILHYRLAPHFQENLPTPSLTLLSEVMAETQLLIAALARAGHNTTENAYYAFRDGYYQLPKKMRSPVPTNLPTASLPALSKALNRLQKATPEVSKQIADACTHTVIANGNTTDIEAELLRTILIALRCPLPACLTAVTSAGASTSAYTSNSAHTSNSSQRQAA